MGGVVSKGDNKTPVLKLCKERKDLIKAAGYARYHLAKSHLLYSRSLLDFSKSLNQFVHEDVVVISYSDDDDDSSSSTDLICCGSDSDSELDSQKDGNRVDQKSTPEPVPVSKEDQNPVSEDKKTCGPREPLGFSEKEFTSTPVEDVVRVPGQNSSFIDEKNKNFDVLGLYECLFIELDERDEVESDKLREIREKEGIPDLESESDHNSLIRKKKQKKNAKEKSSSSSSSSSSLASAAGEVDKKDIKFNNVQDSSSVANVAGEDDKRSETFPEETPEIVPEARRLDEEVCDEAYETCSSSASDSSGSGMTDLRSIVEKINGICQKVVAVNKEVSELLEVSKVVHHQSLVDQTIRVLASMVLGTSANSTGNLLAMPRLRQENSAGSLSLTLDRLYTLEEKLYEAVTVEERLRVSYDKECKLVEHLDQTGAESSKIEEAEARVKYYSSNIDVSFGSVKSISMTVHNTRDEELLIQVNRIINGFKKMWREMAKCHHKQFRAIARSNSCVHIVDDRGSSSREATHKVEVEIRNYKEALRGYIHAHKGFVELLNEWLNRNIMKDDETETEAPAVFRVCSEWQREIASVDEVQVLSAVEELELRFRGLGLKQAKEEKQRRRKERSFNELKRKTKEQDLLPLREKILFVKETEKHERLVKEVNDAVSLSLQESLVPVFEALEDFCFSNFKAYNNIRIVSTETPLFSES